jgi:hypothetical protein
VIDFFGVKCSATQKKVRNKDAHRGKGGGRGGIKVYPPSKIFAKLVNKNAIKHQKGAPSPKNFHNPYIPSVPKFGKNHMDPPSGFFKPCASMVGNHLVRH